VRWRAAVAIAIVFSAGGKVWAQDPAAPAAPEAQPAVAQAPAPTRANVVTIGGRPWDVLIDDQVVCSTPCSGPVFPQQVMVLHSQDYNPVLLEVGQLPAGDLVVSVKPYQRGKYAGGIVATTLGGMAIAIGITFLSVGLAKDRDGMTIAGAITGGVGLLTLPWGIYLMTSAVPSVSVDRASPSGAIAGLGGRF
jgi:hypothetical protein